MALEGSGGVSGPRDMGVRNGWEEWVGGMGGIGITLFDMSIWI